MWQVARENTKSFQKLAEDIGALVKIISDVLKDARRKIDQHGKDHKLQCEEELKASSVLVDASNNFIKSVFLATLLKLKLIMSSN